jgi:polysaccharide biosynthesis transport protein
MKIGIKTVQDFMSLLIRRRWWIVAPFIALSCLVAILTKELPKVYVSEALVIVRPRDVPENFVMDFNSSSTQQRLKSIQQMVLSRSNLTAIARQHLTEMPDNRNLTMDELVDRLRKQISVRFSFEPDSRGIPSVIAFSLTCQDKDPRMAQAIAAQLTTLFMQRDEEERGTKVKGTTNFLSNELEKQDTALVQSDTHLLALKSQNLEQLPEGLEGNLRALDRLSADKRANEEALIRLASTRLGLEQLMAQVPEHLEAPKPVNEKEQDPSVKTYLNSKAEYQGTLAGRAADHPDVQIAKMRMERARKQVPEDVLEALENPKPAEKAEEDASLKYKNPTYTTFENEMRNLRTEYDIRIADRKMIDDAIAKTTQRINNTPRVALALNPVIRDNTDLRRERDELKSGLTKATLSANLEDRQQGSNFILQDEASLPSDAQKPNKWWVLGMGCLASLALSIGFAFIVDLARQRVWTQSEIETLWNVPVMVDIPAIVTDADQIVLRRKKLAFATFFLAAFAVYSVFLYGVYLKQHYILQQLEPVLQTLVYR